MARTKGLFWAKTVAGTPSNTWKWFPMKHQTIACNPLKCNYLTKLSLNTSRSASPKRIARPATRETTWEKRDPAPKLGMKNSLFFGSAEAGANNALLHTLIGNCKRQGLDPPSSLTEAIKRLPVNATPKQAAALTPSRIAAESRDGKPRPPESRGRILGRLQPIPATVIRGSFVHR